MLLDLRSVTPAAPAKAELLAPGAQVGRYHLLRRLAIGGMAELHLACAEGVAGFQKVVVLKRVLPHLAADEGFVELFLNEARLAANLDHPNLVQVIDIGEAGGEYFYVMEYVHGRNARELLAAAAHRGGMPLTVALAIVVAAAAGLHHAHERTDLEGRPLGLVHRDVSPSNVLVSYDGATKLTDFGIAKASARSTETIGGAMKGKIGYMSPEQCRGEPVDRRSDVFSLGILLYELTTTERLFYADNDFAVLNRVVRGDIDPPTSRVPGYPPALERIVLRALGLAPDDRYPTAEALLRDVEAFAHEARLKISVATVADWMGEVFGRPPYPRVEARPADDPFEAIPTLVLVNAPPVDPQAPTRADPSPATAVTLEPGGTEVAEPPRRRGVGGIVAGVVVMLAMIGGLGWWMAGGEPQPEPEPPTSSPANPPTPVAAGSPTEPVDAVEDPVTSGSTGAPEPELADAADSGTTTEAETPEPASRPSRRKKRKKKKAASGGQSSGSKDDPNVLYPVKR